MWYLCCGSHIQPLWRESTIHFVSVCFPGAYFYRFPVTFVDCRVKMVPKIECSFLPNYLQVATLLDKAPARSHSGALERSRVQKLMPNGASGNSKTFQNRGSGRNILLILRMFFHVCQCTVIHLVCVEDANNQHASMRNAKHQRITYHAHQWS